MAGACRVLALLLVAVLLLVLPRGVRAGVLERLKVGGGERLLVIAPHPDDETIAAGGLIERVHDRGGVVRVVLVTAGDGFAEAVRYETGSAEPSPAAYIAYGERRLREARAALRVLAPERARLQLLGFPDGGLAELLDAHWRRGQPLCSRTTLATDPPYRDALEPDVPYDGSDLLRELQQIVREMRPTMVAFPDPLDHHPDHRAVGLFALLALAEPGLGTERRGARGERQGAGAVRPKLLAYLVHWPDWPPGWDAVAVEMHPDVALDLPAGVARADGERVELVLTDAELARKTAALEKYASQFEVMGPYVAAFLRRTEPFTRLAPAEIEREEEKQEERIKSQGAGVEGK